MKFKINETVKYYADDTEKYYHGVVKEISKKNKKSNLAEYRVSFLGGDFWFYENELIKITNW